MMQPMQLDQLAVLISAVGLGGTAIYQAGVLRGRFDKHELSTERRLDALEEQKITREELDARFDALGQQLQRIERKLDTTTGR